MAFEKGSSLGGTHVGHSADSHVHNTHLRTSKGERESKWKLPREAGRSMMTGSDVVTKRWSGYPVS